MYLDNELILIIAALLYFVPTVVAIGKKGARGPIVANIFLGWSLVGWVFALGWAIYLPKKIEERVCPHCAETIKAAADVCRFCGRDVAANEET